MSSRVNHPLKSFVLFVLVLGAAWAGYEYLYKRGLLTSEASELLSKDRKDGLREAILKFYDKDPCFRDMRGNMNWRPNEQRYRVELIVVDGCEDRAKSLCEEIAQFIKHETNAKASVWAFDSGQREVAHFVD
jgi:hypothetical protein